MKTFQPKCLKWPAIKGYLWQVSGFITPQIAGSMLLTSYPELSNGLQGNKENRPPSQKLLLPLLAHTFLRQRSWFIPTPLPSHPLCYEQSWNFYFQLHWTSRNFQMSLRSRIFLVSELDHISRISFLTKPSSHVYTPHMKNSSRY